MRDANAIAISAVIPTDANSWVDVIVDQYNKIRGRVYVPSAALNNTARQSTLHFRPVGASVLRGLSGTGIILSGAFACSGAASTRYNLTFEASADVPDTLTTNDVEIDPQDICLATISDDQQTLTCVETNYDTRVADNNQPWQDESRRPKTVLTSNFSACDDTTYVFIYSPLGAKPIVPTPAEPSFFEQNQTPIIAGLVGGFLFLIFMFYVGWRLSRYYRKYKEQEKELEMVEQQKDEAIERDQGLMTASNDTEDISYVLNPMVVQMRNLDEQLEEVTQKMGVQARQDDRRIWELERKKEQIMQEKKRLEAEIEAARIRERDDALLRQRMQAANQFGQSSSTYNTNAQVGYAGETAVPRIDSIRSNEETGFAPRMPKKKTFN